MEQKDPEVRIGKSVRSEPAVSVIMPAFNAAPYISEAIESVLTQTFTDYEIIVINDGSEDTPDLEKALGPFLEHVVYVKHENRGVAAARNTGLRLARAPLVAQLDSDDSWLPHFLETQLEIMTSDPGIDVLYANSQIFGGSVFDGKESMEISPSHGEVTLTSLLSQECTVHTNLIGKKEAFFRVGGYDESLPASEDFDMWLRIVKSGGRIDYHRRVVARYRKRPDSLSADTVFMTRSILRVFTKAEQTFDLTEAERETLIENKLRFEAFLSLCEGKRAFVEKCFDAAVERLTNANRYYKSTKIAMAIWVMRVAPGIAFTAFEIKEGLRGRFVPGDG